MAEPVIAQKFPYGVDVEAGKEYWWCQCGESAKQPFCDGTHKKTQFRPVQYLAQATGKVFFCGCKRSAKRPVCDGTHKTVA
jgi:CDGSH-type Zn-finger protein